MGSPLVEHEVLLYSQGMVLDHYLRIVGFLPFLRHALGRLPIHAERRVRNSRLLEILSDLVYPGHYHPCGLFLL